MLFNRDLKPDNVLLDEYLYPKMTDFGLPMAYNRERVSEHITSTLGTPIYVSPEIWDSNDHSCASDIYAFAFIVYEIITNPDFITKNIDFDEFVFLQPFRK